MHLLVLSLFPLTASLTLILLNFLNSVSWEQPSFLSLSLLYLDASCEDMEAKRVVMLGDFS